MQIKFVLSALTIVFAACGGGAELRILVPIDGPNPFQTMQPNKATAAVYFRFMEMQQGYTDMSQVITGKDVWYPAQGGAGIDPYKTKFAIDEANLSSSRAYRVEIWGKNNQTDPQYTYYGYPDCPMIIDKGTGVNICFGDYIGPNQVRNCIGMKSIASGQCAK